MSAKPERTRCTATVYHRDTYRVCRDGRRQFRLHYTRTQCKRRATNGEYCWQHVGEGK